MAYTLGEAAKATGISKPTLSRAIKNGKISAVQREDGSYQIDPAELHRVYPAKTGETVAGGVGRATHETDLLLKIRELETRLDGTLSQLQREREISTSLERDRDHWRQQATALLTDQRPKERPRMPPWLSRLLGYTPRA